jgi:hypothetical protein
MRKDKFYKYILVAVISLNALSCKDFFEVDSGSVFTEEMVLNSVSSYTGIWAYLYNGLDKGFTQTSATMIANASDEADNNQPFDPIQRFNTGTWNGFNNPENVNWIRYYGYIRQANLLKELSDTTIHPEITFEIYRRPDPDKYKEYKAEWYAFQIDAEFFKAYYHFELWKRFGNIPIIDSLISVDEARNMKQNSKEEIVNYIAGKINKIISMYDVLTKMPGSKYAAFGNKGGGKWQDNNSGRITKGAALALKCRMYLYAASPLHNNGSYNQALCDSAAFTAVQLMKLDQYSTTGTNYRDLFLNANNSENICSGTYTGKSNLLEKENYPRVAGTNYDDNAVGVGATCPSQNLVDAYMTNSGFVSDFTFTGVYPFDKVLDKRFNQTVIYPGDVFNGSIINTQKNGVAERNSLKSTTTGYFLKKFVVENLNLKTNQTAEHVWYVFRYGEVLLNYAEAALNGSKGSAGDYGAPGGLTAAKALNLLHARLDKSDGVAVLPVHKDFSDATLTNEKIQKERQVELAFEGHRFWDVRRWKIAEFTENRPLIGIEFDPFVDNPYSRVQVEPRLFVAPKMYFFPIPQEDFNNYSGWTNNGW